MGTVRVLIADDQRLMREALRTLLELEADIDVVAEAADGNEAVEVYQRLKPDVVLMDVRMPALDGVEATRRIVRADPSARVIILTTFNEDQYVIEGLRAGAVGFLLKDVSGAELVHAIRTVMQGGALLEPSVARRMFAEFARLSPSQRAANEKLIEPLSEREIEVLRLMSAGLTNREISQRLCLAEGTVKNYVTSVLGKLGVRDRTQAALRGYELGLI